LATTEQDASYQESTQDEELIDPKSAQQSGTTNEVKVENYYAQNRQSPDAIQP
jgi:hypothetical protein